MMIARLALAALVPLALGDYSYSYETEAPSAAPTSSMAPTRTETYAPTRMTEAPSWQRAAGRRHELQQLSEPRPQ